MLTLYVLGYLPKRGPNRYFITGNSMEVAICGGGGIVYDAAMIFKRFVMGIHRSLVDYHRKEPIMRSFGSLSC